MKDDRCMICLERLRIPCFFVKRDTCKCMCRYDICTDCCEQYISTFGNLNMLKCLICKHPVGDNERTYLYNVYRAKKLDCKYNDTIKCKKCKVWEGSRIDLYKHCYICYGKDFDDTAICVSCGEDYSSHEIYNHTNECVNIPCNHCKCKFSINTIAKHIKKCPLVPILCQHCHEYIVEPEKHKLVCANQPLSCKICSGIYKRATMPNHLEVCILNLSNRLIRMEKKYQKLKTKYKRVKKSLKN